MLKDESALLVAIVPLYCYQLPHLPVPTPPTHKLITSLKKREKKKEKSSAQGSSWRLFCCCRFFNCTRIYGVLHLYSSELKREMLFCFFFLLLSSTPKLPTRFVAKCYTPPPAYIRWKLPKYWEREKRTSFSSCLPQQDPVVRVDRDRGGGGYEEDCTRSTTHHTYGQTYGGRVLKQIKNIYTYTHIWKKNKPQKERSLLLIRSFVIEGSLLFLAPRNKKKTKK